jgi:hypothetical protein
LAVGVLLGSPVAAEDAGLEALRQFGLLGTWTIDCTKPVSSVNPEQVYAIGEKGPTRTLRIADKDLDGTFEMRSIHLIGDSRLAYNDSRVGGETSFDVILEKKDGRVRSVSSVRNDGTVMITDSNFAGSLRRTPTFEKCHDREPADAHAPPTSAPSPAPPSKE